MKRRFSIVVVSLFVFLISMTSVVFAWPPYIEGRPSEFRPGYSRGYYLWRDNSGFNLRTASYRQGHVFPALSGQTEIWLRSACCAPKAATG